METPPIFPKFPLPGKLAAFKTQGLSWEERIALSSLQGLVNRRKPRIYQIWAPCDQRWLEYYTEKHSIGHELVEDPMTLLESHRDVPNGLVVYDPDMPDTANLAVTISGIEGLLLVTGALADKLDEGWAVKKDLTGRFEDRVSAYRWAWDELFPQCNRHILGSLCVGKRPIWMQNRTAIIDYLVANRSLVIHLSAARRDRDEAELFDEILEGAGPRGVLLGWHCARDKEKEYVARAARKGFFVLCSAGSPNMTVHGGIPRSRERYTQREPEAIKDIENKVYVSLYLTDGDAIWAMDNHQSENWMSENRGEIPFNWGLLPLIYDIAPGMLDYYYETATENDYFVCPSSGAGYTYSYLHDDWYLHYSKRYMDLTGQIAANMVNWDTTFWWREVEDPKAIYREKRIIKPAGLVTGLGGSVFATSYPLGTPKVHASVVLHEGEECSKKLMQLAAANPQRPLFLFAFVQISKGVYDHLVRDLRSLPDEIELLHMDKFMMTLRKCIREGTVGSELYPDRENSADDLISAGHENRSASVELLRDLARVAELPHEEMVEELNLGNWINLASHDPVSVKGDAESWRRQMTGFLRYDTANPADALAYNLFYTAWAYVRACLNEIGHYANHMDSCLDEYLDRFPDDGNSVLEEIWQMWHDWDRAPPAMEEVKDLTRRAWILVSSMG